MAQTSEIGFNYKLESALEATAQAYDAIIIDSPGTAGVAQISAAFAADEILVPVQLEAKIHTTTDMIQRIAADFASTRSGRSPRYLGIQPNMYISGAATHDFYLAELASLNLRVFDPIKHFRSIASAGADGIPLKQYRPNSKANENFLAIADAIIDSMEGETYAKIA